MKKIIPIILFSVVLLTEVLAQGNCLNFDGGNDGVNLNTALFSSSNGSQPYTIEAWIKAPPQSDNCIICQHDFPGTNRFQFGIGNHKLVWEKNGGANQIFSSTTIDDDAWHHVAATRDATGNLILYVDGVQDGNGTDLLPFLNTNTNIGERILTNGGHFLGNIDEVRIWSGARTQADIQSTMNQELSGGETGLLAYYKFNQGVAGGNNDGLNTLTGELGNNGTLNDFTLMGPLSNWISSTFPLPVELIRFEGSNTEGRTTLFWETARESNNWGFEILKSQNGRDWFVLDTVTGNGTSDVQQEYSYEDSNPFEGMNYYRLKQIDFDGKFKYSKTVLVDHSYLGKYIKVFPNPSSRIVNVLIDNPLNQTIKNKLFDGLGRVVWEEEKLEGPASWNAEIVIRREGGYILCTQIGNEVFYQQVIVNHGK